MENNNNNSSNSLVFGRWLQTKITWKALVHSVVVSRTGSPIDDPATETAVYKWAEETLTLFSKRLGSEPYLFGKSPTSADAVLYAHLVRPLFD